MTGKKPALGRGLGALLGEATARQVTANAAAIAANRAPPTPALPSAPAAARRAVAPAVAAPLVDELARLPVDLLQRGKYQPRLDMRPETLQELADSIRAQGVVQPIVVRPLVAEAAARRSRSATRSSPASAAGAPRRWPASPRSRP
jgi:ParB family transcriptional regulator, chromosome partitioning protein